MPHDHGHVLADWHKASKEQVAQAIEAAAAAAARVGELALGGPRRRLPQGRRAAGHDVARHAQRRHHARPVEDRLPGRDRLGRRARRLLALQPVLRAGALRRAAALDAARCGTSSTTGRSRASSTRSRPSTSRRSPATCRPRRPSWATPSCGSRPRLGGPERLVPSCKLLEAAGLPPGVINFVPGDAARHLRRRPQPPRPRRRPLHRLDRGLQLDVAHDRRPDGPLPLLPAHRGRDRRQGLHRGPRLGRPAGAGGGRRARRLRVPGAEVLGREPPLRAALDLERRARPHRRR